MNKDQQRKSLLRWSELGVERQLGNVLQYKPYNDTHLSKVIINVHVDAAISGLLLPRNKYQ